ncbi:MAG: hypothetical protein JO189_13155 [Deltaproteobacteria bacterium]|nr:hypothetical protein [Deltaproteobacteria bacterium]
MPKEPFELRCAWVCCLCAFVVTVFALAGCGYPLIHDGQVDQKQAASIEASVAHIRELDFTRQVPVVINTPDQAQQAIIAQIARDHSDEDLRIGGESGAMTGLYPPDIDLKRRTVELLRNQIIGFYNPDTKQMVVVQPPHDRASLEVQRLGPGMGAMVLAHELTHALQDQHFGIEKMLNKVKDNDDQTLALKCVAEGDATIAGFGYVAGRLEPANVDLLVSQLDTLPANSAVQEHDIPLAVTVPMMFQYSGGSHFVAEAWRRGGWSGVDQLYHNPPRSSQQIMQPELYFDHPTPPVHIELTGYEDLLAGWKKVDDDTYGELLLKLILQRNLPPQAPAFGTLPRWAGDRIITLQKGNELTLLWLIAFHDQSAAHEFADTYSQILDHLGDKSNPHAIATRDTTVLIAIGPGAKDFAQLQSAVWKASKISPAV